MVTINNLAEIIMGVAGKRVRVKHIPGPLGVRGRNSDNRLIREKLGWEPKLPLRDGLVTTYAWIAQQVAQSMALSADGRSMPQVHVESPILDTCARNAVEARPCPANYLLR
jgi:hypothetical protein